MQFNVNVVNKLVSLKVYVLNVIAGVIRGVLVGIARAYLEVN